MLMLNVLCVRVCAYRWVDVDIVEVFARVPIIHGGTAPVMLFILLCSAKRHIQLTKSAFTWGYKYTRPHNTSIHIRFLFIQHSIMVTFVCCFGVLFCRFDCYVYIIFNGINNNNGKNGIKIKWVKNSKCIYFAFVVRAQCREYASTLLCIRPTILHSRNIFFPPFFTRFVCEAKIKRYCRRFSFSLFSMNYEKSTHTHRYDSAWFFLLHSLGYYCLPKASIKIYIHFFIHSHCYYYDYYDDFFFANESGELKYNKLDWRYIGRCVLVLHTFPEL